jgi:hypothetical protein
MSERSQREIDLAYLVFKLPSLGDQELSENELSLLRKEYVNVLAKHDLLYHFDEDIVNIHWDVNPNPNKTEMQQLDCLTSYLYSEELFTLALQKI